MNKSTSYYVLGDDGFKKIHYAVQNEILKHRKDDIIVISGLKFKVESTLTTFRQVSGKEYMLEDVYLNYIGGML